MLTHITPSICWREILHLVSNIREDQIFAHHFTYNIWLHKCTRVYVRWAPTDFVGPLTATTTGSPISIASTAISEVSEPTNYRSALQTRTKTVIGLGVTLGVFFTSTCALMIIFFQNKRNSNSKTSTRIDKTLAMKAATENEKVSEMPTQPWSTTELHQSDKGMSYKLRCTV